MIVQIIPKTSKLSAIRLFSSFVPAYPTIPPMIPKENGAKNHNAVGAGLTCFSNSSSSCRFDVGSGDRPSV